MNQLNNFDPKANKKPVSDKRKGQTALFFPKWHTPPVTPQNATNAKLEPLEGGFSHE